MPDHVLQFNDGGADWCIHCGEFAHCLSPTCEGGSGEYDNRVPANVARVIRAVFGMEADHA